MFDRKVVDAVAEHLRSMEIDGHKVFSKVYTEAVGEYIHLDIEGVEGELFFNIEEKLEAVPAWTPGRWYCFECDTIFTGVISRSQIPCIDTHDVKKLNDVVWAALCDKYGPVVAAEGAPRVVDVSGNPLALPRPTGHRYGLQRQPGPSTPVHKWKPITEVFVDIEDNILAPVPAEAQHYYGQWADMNVRIIPEGSEVDGHTREWLASQGFSPVEGLRVEVDGKPAPEGASRQWLISNGYLPIDTPPVE